MKLALLILFTGMAFGQADQAITGAFSIGDIGLVAEKIYACGIIEGSRKTLIADGRVDTAQKVMGLWREADCDTVVELLVTLKGAKKP